MRRMSKTKTPNTPATTTAPADIRAPPPAEPAPRAPTPPVNGPTRVLGGHQVNFRLPTEEHVAAFDAWLANQGYTNRPDGICAIIEAWAGENAPTLSAKMDAALLASVTAEAEAAYAREVEKMQAKLREAEEKLKGVTENPRLAAAKKRAATRGA